MHWLISMQKGNTNNRRMSKQIALQRTKYEQNDVAAGRALNHNTYERKPERISPAYSNY